MKYLLVMIYVIVFISNPLYSEDQVNDEDNVFSAEAKEIVLPK